MSLGLVILGCALILSGLVGTTAVADGRVRVALLYAGAALLITVAVLIRLRP